MAKGKPRAKRINTNVREHRFDCKVNVDLFKAANAARTKTWPELVEGMMQDIVLEAGLSGGKKK